jgi:two-component system chemotaxis sensor kinase CheA
MAINLEQFHQTFFEESFEGLDVMESGLLNLQRGGNADRDAINAIFRAAHSIKGGSGTFGFAEVAKFTHVLETLLDQMRDGRRAVTPETVNLLLQSVDVLREMLAAVRAKASIDAGRTGETQARLEAMLAGRSAIKASAPDPRLTTFDSTGWLIRFRPKPHLFKTGNDPVRILRELAALGTLDIETDCSALPDLDVFDPETSYLGWLIKLQAPVARAAVSEVFAWVEDDAELTIEPLAVETAVAQRQGGERRAGEDRRAGGSDSSSIRVDTAKVDGLINMVGELVITQNILQQIGERFDVSKLGQLHKTLADLERNTRELQESVMRIRMLPISFAFNRFPRLVHDVSQKLGKQVELKMAGEGTELDKTVLEKIVDPLVHLVRNSLDHGIETPERRLAVGKPESGRLTLAACHKGGNIEIEIADDGAGLNRDKILRKAQERGLVKASDHLSDEQIDELIFLPGFSTADQVSDLSGRGVGMDVVRKNIGSLGGQVEIQSTPGQGSRFTVRLPLTLAIVEGQSAAVGNEFYIVPLVSIVVSLQVKPEQVNRMAGRGEVFRFRDEVLPVIRLYEIFGSQPRTKDLHAGLLIVVEGDGRRAGLFVDELLGQQQVVIKSLEANYKRVEGVSGATILGDGSVALILDIPGLIRIAHQRQAA